MASDSDPLGLRLLRLPYDALSDFLEDDGPGRAAALSFYALLSLAPMFLVVAEVAGWWLGTEQAITQLHAWVSELVQGEAAGALHTLLDGLAEQDLLGASGIWGWVGAGATIFTATTLVAQLQTALNRTWRVRPDPERAGYMMFLIKRGISLAIVFGVILAVTATAVAGSLTSTMIDWIVQVVPGNDSGWMWRLGSSTITWLLLAGLLTVGFQVLPDARIRWRDAAFGGVITGALVLGGSWLLGWYLSAAAVGSAWGASGAIAVFLIWVYYTANILLLGAELTRCWALCFGGGMEPGRYAVRVRIETVEKTASA